MKRPVIAFLLVGACTSTAAPSTVGRHSSSMALMPDGSRLFVANPDSDSVSVIDTGSGILSKEILLTRAPPQADTAGRYTPAVSPRALALSPKTNRLYVSGERSGALYAIDLATLAVVQQITVGSEPIGVLVSPDESSVYVACSNDDQVVRIDPKSGRIVARAKTARKPWALAWSIDDRALYVTHLLGPGVSMLDPESLARRALRTVPNATPRGDPRLAYGQVRGLYDLLPRPGSDELWVTHLLLATQTAQPTLDFQSTVFPAISILAPSGSLVARLTTDAPSVAGVDGAFGDVVSGPHALAFTADGRYALLVDTASEDILVVDTQRRTEAALVRPLPGHQPEGIVLSPDGATAYVQERNSGDVAVIHVDTSGPAIQLSVEPRTIPLWAADPMPAELRFGQHLFYSANSDELPITRNHWVSCASCHIEGRSDGVTWLFAQGPRDTPSNAGGTLDTGFLFHTADRGRVQDYWQTIDVEQGGHFKNPDPMQAAQLGALAAFVDEALPIPIPPHTDPALVARGKVLFESAEVGCTACHSGPARTDSGAGNPTLDPDGPVVLHDVGTCNTGAFPDVGHRDITGHPRAACEFDTPALRGLVDSAPYFHDGSAATLQEVLEKTRGQMGTIEGLSRDDLNALVEYLRSL